MTVRIREWFSIALPGVLIKNRYNLLVRGSKIIQEFSRKRIMSLGRVCGRCRREYIYIYIYIYISQAFFFFCKIFITLFL